MLSFYRAKKKIAAEIKKAFSNPKDKILDVGSGISPWYHRAIRGSLTTFDRVENKKYVNVTGTMERLPFDDASFDKVISVNALYFAKDPEKTFNETIRVLKKGGIALLVTPFMHPIHDIPHDRYRFTEYAIESFLRKECGRVKIIPVGSIFTLPLTFLRSIIRGTSTALPASMRSITQVLLIILFFPFLIIAQLLTLLDPLDNSRRSPLYYITIARKK